MKILVLGGSYFFGRVFVMEASKNHEITVVNRGTYSMDGFGVTQIKGDRSDVALWESITEDYDVLVDFCGYNKGDIRTVFEHMGGHIGQYIFISTVDVYRRGLPGYKDEDTSMEERELPGDAGAYIAGKVALEKELCSFCEEKNVPFTILRPAILYGPFNYAPREGVFIQLMAQQGLLPVITDAEGSFQLIYVKDGAHAIIRCLGNEKAYGQSYNLCGDETVTYTRLGEVLQEGAKKLREEQQAEPVNIVPMTVAQAEAQGLPLSFPVTKEETELCSNEKSKAELGMEYVSLEDGMERTCRAFWNVYC